MAWVAIGIGGVTAITSGISAINSSAEKKRLAKEAANMKDVELNNVADGMRVSTRGSDLRKEQQARLASGQIGAIQEGGARAILGGVGRVAASSQDVNAQIGADLDQQQQNIENVRAEDSGRIRMTQEQRQQAKLGALSSQYNAANAIEGQSYQNMIQGATMAGNAASKKWIKNGSKKKKGDDE